MQKIAFATLDRFIPAALKRDRSDLGLARSFIVTHLLGPFLVQTIVGVTLTSDPRPSTACWALLACVTGFWLLPFGLRLTGDLQLMALISVELLSVVSLIGSSFYGGVNSPFLPWLLVSLMLGFFYLSDHTLRVLILFGCNLVAITGIHLVYTFPQHLSPAELAPISWFSMFAATAFMSIMAVYYGRIVTMRSELESETERHRLMAQRLRSALHKADAAKHGKTVFLGKMKRQFEDPLRHIVERSRALIDARVSHAAPGHASELARIHATGRQLLDIVRDVIDQKEVAVPSDDALREVGVIAALEEILAKAHALLASDPDAIRLDTHRDLGRIRIDVDRLQQVCEAVMQKAMRVMHAPRIRFEAVRHHRATGDWIEIRIGATPSFAERSAGTVVLAGPQQSGAQIEAELEGAQLHCAVLGGSLAVSRDGPVTLRFTIEVPAVPVDLTTPGHGPHRLQQVG